MTAKILVLRRERQCLTFNACGGSRACEHVANDRAKKSSEERQEMRPA
jgi:hypothetical protein